MAAGENAMAQQAGQQSSYTTNGKTYNADSPYMLVSQNEYMNQNPITQKTCKITHQVTVDVIQGGGPKTGRMTCPAGTVPIASTCKWISCVMQNLSGCSGGYKKWICYRGATTQPGTYFWAYSDSSGSTGCGFDNACNLSCTSGSHWRQWPYNTGQGNGYHTYTGPVEPSDTTILYNGFPGSWPRYIYLNNSTHVVDCTRITQQTTNSCAGQDFSNCKIKDLQVCDQNGNNCSYIYRDYQYVNPQIQPMCYSISSTDGLLTEVCANGSSISYQDNNVKTCPGYQGTIPSQGILDQANDNTDWWMVKKTYDCPSPKGTVTPSIKREQDIESQGTYSQTTGLANYPDTGTGGNGISPYSGNYQAKWQYNAPSSPCVYSCIVSIRPSRTVVVGGGVATTNNSELGTPPDAQTIDKTYLACNQDPSTKQWTCPATGDEQIIQPCVCLDKGGESIAIMSAMVSAAQDLTCSSQ
jgi:hypothetical protein